MSGASGTRGSCARYTPSSAGNEGGAVSPKAKKRRLNAVARAADFRRRRKKGSETPVSDGVFELRFHFGPGYRVYCGRVDRTTVLLLRGGTKRTQDADIDRAKAYWTDFRKRKHG